MTLPKGYIIFLRSDLILHFNGATQILSWKVSQIFLGKDLMLHLTLRFNGRPRILTLIVSGIFLFHPKKNSYYRVCWEEKKTDFKCSMPRS